MASKRRITPRAKISPPAKPRQQLAGSSSPPTRDQAAKLVGMQSAARSAGGTINSYDQMSGAQLSKVPPIGRMQRAAFGSPGNRTPAQQANFNRVREYNSKQPGGQKGVGPSWNS